MNIITIEDLFWLALIVITIIAYAILGIQFAIIVVIVGFVLIVLRRIMINNSVEVEHYTPLPEIDVDYDVTISPWSDNV